MAEDFRPTKTWLHTPDINKVANAFVDVGGEKIIKVFDVNAGQEVEDEGGAGAPFKKISYASELKSVTKGGKTKYVVPPRVLIENMTDDTNNIKTLGSGGVTDVGQVFRLTGGIDNIERVHLTLEAAAGAAIQTIDSFESYADTTALRAVWVPNDTANTPNSLETTVIAEGAKAMRLQMTSTQKSKNDDITRTYGTNQDWSGFTGIQLQYRAGDTGAIIEIQIEDASGNGSKRTITASTANTYEFIQLNFANFVPVGAVPADLATVKKIKFFIKTAKVTSVYFDIIELFSTAAFGTAKVELHSFGTNPSPTQISGSPLASTTINLEAGKVVYEVPFSVTGLTPNNYYGLVITEPSVATVKVYGKNGSNQYTNGFAFSSINNLDITTTGSGDDMYFMVFAKDKAIFNGIRFAANGSTGTGKLNAFINDNASKKGRTSLFLGETLLGRQVVDYPTKEQTSVSVKMKKDELVLVDFFDDASSLVTKLQVTIYYTFIDRPING